MKVRLLMLSDAARASRIFAPCSILAIVMSGFMLIGCRGRAAREAEPATQPAPVAMVPTSGPTLSYTLTMTDARPADPRKNLPPVFQVEVYQIALPFGSISRDEVFWKSVDEYAVDVATHDLLWKNGVRVGLLPEREMPRAKQLIEQNPANVQRSSIVGSDAKNVELEIRRDVEFQNIFFFDQSNQPVGRTYEWCTNYITFSFEPAIRKTNTLRVTFCPAVRSMRKKLDFTARNQEIERDVMSVERLYDMNLRADILPDSALVIAPSPDASRQISIGQSFFTRPGPAELQEYLIMVIARPVKPLKPAIAR